MGADAHKAQAQLQQAQQRGGQLAVESATLAQALEQEAALNKQASAEILQLEQQLQEATKQASEASKTLEKVCSIRTLKAPEVLLPSCSGPSGCHLACEVLIDNSSGAGHAQ